MLFSVLIPNRGYKESFRKCIQSIKNQVVNGNFSYELIVCDQSDPEDREKISSTLLEILGNNNYKLIPSRDRGVLISRHKLIQEAKGEYIVFIDSDDYVEDSYLSNIYNFLSKYKFPDIFIHNFCFESEEGIKPNILPEMVKDNIFDYFLYSDLLNSVVVKTFKKKLYDFSDYTDFSTQNGDDWVLSYPMMKKAKTIVADFSFCGYFYQVNNESVTHAISVDVAKRTLSFRVGYKEFETINKNQNRIFTKHYISTFNYLLRRLTLNGVSKKEKISFVKYARNLIFKEMNCSKIKFLSKRENMSYLLLKFRFYSFIVSLFVRFKG